MRHRLLPEVPNGTVAKPAAANVTATATTTAPATVAKPTVAVAPPKTASTCAGGE